METTLPRLRQRTNDPAREYAQRPGAVAPLSNDLAALLTMKKGKREVRAGGITVDGKVYWSEKSMTIATRVGQQVLFAVNRLSPDLLHVLGEGGEYLESIPLQTKAAILDPAGFAREGAQVKRAKERVKTRLAHLHTPDTRAALESDRANVSKMERAINIFPAADGDRERSKADKSKAGSAPSRRGNLLGDEEARRVAEPGTRVACAPQTSASRIAFAETAQVAQKAVNTRLQRRSQSFAELADDALDAFAL